MPYLIYRRKTGTGAVNWITTLGTAGVEVGHGVRTDSNITISNTTQNSRVI